MKRVFKGVVVLWAMALVGWAIARAQGWVGDPTVADVEDASPRLMPATKSDAGEGARAKRDPGPDDAADEGLRGTLGGTKAGPVFVPQDAAPTRQEAPAPEAAPQPPADWDGLLGHLPAAEDEALLPATKSDMMNGIGGLIGTKGTTTGAEGLGARGSGLGHTNPPPEAQSHHEPAAPR